MSEDEYIGLVRHAASLLPVVVRALQNRHHGENIALIEDAAEEALIVFSNREKILTIDNPEEPLHWLINTADHLLSHEHRKHLREIKLDDLAAEPNANDTAAKEFNWKETLRVVLEHLNEKDRNIIEMHVLKNIPIEEIAAMEGRSKNAIYHSYERAMKKAHEIAVKLKLIPREER